MAQSANVDPLNHADVVVVSIVLILPFSIAKVKYGFVVNVFVTPVPQFCMVITVLYILVG